MHFIITDAWLAPSRALHLSGAKLALTLVALSLPLMIAAAVLSHWVLLKGVWQRGRNRPRHDLVTRYAHAARFTVRKGDFVRRAQKIAEVGSTGRSTGPHLHFEVLVRGVPQNPQKFLSAAGAGARMASAAGARPGKALDQPPGR